MKLCNEEITLGARWGSKPRPDLKAPNLDESPDVDRQTLRDLHDMFQGIGAEEPDLGALVSPVVEDEEPPPVVEDEEPPPVVEVVADPAPVEAEEEDTDSLDSLLDSIPAPAEKPSRSVDDLLDDLDL